MSQPAALKILIIDDSPEDRWVYQRYLKQHPQQRYHIIETGLGQEGIHLAESEQPDCILLDYHLPDLNGLEILAQLSRKKISSAVIMLTGQSHPDRDILALKAGASDYLAKEKLNSQILHRVIRYAIERKGTEHKLQHLNDEKNHLLGMVAHDLRNPLTSIRGFSELILEEQTTNREEMCELLTIIHNLSEEMLLTLHNLLDVSRIDSGKFDVKLEKNNLSELLHYRIRLSSLTAKRKNIQLIDQVPDHLYALFDPERLNQVVDNFLNNAIKYSPADSQIKINAKKITTGVEVSVTDQGPGIPKAELDHIFATFHTLGSIMPTGGETSSGLGLAIAKKIIDAHQGEIGVRNSAQGGSQFYFKIPINSLFGQQAKTRLSHKS
ncbi:MAG: hybrid sensor histidine kinase/response regulator [Gammaproteobacteria bacterium]|nr:hybrid sensor histidine kinase/response regulator [Gammaproteobacteria bacterium]